MSLMQEFKKFAMRGNVVDLAIGVIIGAAFGKVIGSFVADILTPPIGMLMGGVDFSNMFINLTSTPVKTLAEAQAANIPVISYGVFINTVIDFLIQVFAVFLVIRQINKMTQPQPEPPAPAPQKVCQFCKSMIDAEATRCPNCTSEL